MSMSAMVLSFLQRAHPVRKISQVADQRSVARPFGVLVEGEHAGIRARLEDRARNDRAGGDMDIVHQLQMAEDEGCSAERAIPTDLRAPGNRDAAGHGGMRA